MLPIQKSNDSKFLDSLLKEAQEKIDVKFPEKLEHFLLQLFREDSIRSRRVLPNSYQVIVAPGLPLQINEIIIAAREVKLEHIAAEPTGGLFLEFKK